MMKEKFTKQMYIYVMGDGDSRRVREARVLEV